MPLWTPSLSPSSLGNYAIFIGCYDVLHVPRTCWTGVKTQVAEQLQALQ